MNSDDIKNIIIKLDFRKEIRNNYTEGDSKKLNDLIIKKLLELFNL